MDELTGTLSGSSELIGVLKKSLGYSDEEIDAMFAEYCTSITTSEIDALFA